MSNTLSQGVPLRPLKFFKVTAGQIDAAAVLNTLSPIPPETVLIQITCETQAVRYRDDGTNPTAAVGQPLGVGTTMYYDGNWASQKALRFISQVAGAELQVTCYGEAR